MKEIRVHDTGSERSSDRAIDLGSLPVRKLLRLQAHLEQELRNRKIVRNSNNLVGELADHLFARVFGWQLKPNSTPHIRAEGADGTRYSIKGRRTTRTNTSRQLSAIRDIDGGHVDFLAGVIFDEECCVLRAALIPWVVVKARAAYVSHTNSHKFIMTDDVWDDPRIRDVTAEPRAVTL